MTIKFGPAGLGAVKDAVNNLEKYHKLGLKACEIAFTYQIYIKKKEDAVKIGKEAKKLGISLSIHAPYWINLNSADKEKVEKSKQRILKCCEVANWLKATCIVFHPGYYNKMNAEETYENIKKEIINMQKTIRKNNWKMKICPETTGKKNVFGSIDEIKKLVDETGGNFCLDFAHIRARYKRINYKKIIKKFSKYKNWHIHFSGIEYGEKGEKRHIKTKTREIKELLERLPKNKNIIIINESPQPIKDSIMSLNIYHKINKINCN